MDFELNPVESYPLIRAKYRKDFAELDYLREIRKLLDAGTEQKLIARWSAIHPKDIQNVFEAVQKTTLPLEGFSGAIPLEICKRYAARLIPREQLIEELTNYPYVPRRRTDGYDDLIVNPPGTWSEVFLADVMGLIDSDIYGIVLKLRAERSEKSERSERSES